ncbi:MAG: FIST C-terminal domain-containing protein [Cyclobacteriaceae bacterium]
MMKTAELLFKENNQEFDPIAFDPNLILFFTNNVKSYADKFLTNLSSQYPNAILFGCSSEYAIHDESIIEQGAAATAVLFEKTTLKTGSVRIESQEDSYDKSVELAKSFPTKGLKSVIVFSSRENVNGDSIVRGMRATFPKDVIITGGLAGGSFDNEETFVICNGDSSHQTIGALAFYSDKLNVGYGSIGGWDTFGPERRVTKSKENVLYELDNKPALELYKKYLGEEAKDLPESALLYPLSIFEPGKSINSRVRTILDIDEKNNSMTFAGDIPQGYHAQLMMANFDRLIDGAGEAASHALSSGKASTSNQLALLVSCIGRRNTLGIRAEEEVEAVKNKFGAQTSQIGFYSYGEIAPHVETQTCELHNQTMTITLISED